MKAVDKISPSSLSTSAFVRTTDPAWTNLLSIAWPSWTEPDSESSLVILGNGILRLCPFFLMSSLQSSNGSYAMGASVMGEYWVKSSWDPLSACEEQGVCLFEEQGVCLLEEQVVCLLRCSDALFPSHAPPLLLLLPGYWHGRLLSSITWFWQQYFNQHCHLAQNQDNLWHRPNTYLFFISLKVHQQPVEEMKDCGKLLWRNMKDCASSIKVLNMLILDLDMKN